MYTLTVSLQLNFVLRITMRPQRVKCKLEKLFSLNFFFRNVVEKGWFTREIKSDRPDT